MIRLEHVERHRCRYLADGNTEFKMIDSRCIADHRTALSAGHEVELVKHGADSDDLQALRVPPWLWARPSAP